MVTIGKINLIKEFSEKQKDNDIIVLTTFKFDAPFFDIYLINRILEYNPSAEIFVLMDGTEYAKGYDAFTKHTGRAYHLIPVYCKKGVFHPKLSIFYSENESKITTYIGSCNVTLAGFTSNAEIVTKIESTSDPIDSTVKQAVDYFQELINKKNILYTKFTKAIADISGKIKNLKNNKDVSLIHNLDNSILGQVLDQIEPAEEITMLAPFWSPNPTVIDEINKKQSIKSANLIIQENNHNLSDPKRYADYCDKNKIKLTFLKAKFDKNRIFHSKILELRSKSISAILGSSNMTESALLRSTNQGNFEVAAFVKSNVDEILNEITTEKITDIETIKCREMDYKIAQTDEDILILSVDFDADVTQTLSIIFPKDTVEKTLKIIFEDNSEQIHLIKDVEEFCITCNQIPFEVIVTKGNKTSRRRIFYDENYFYKKISKGNISLTDINRKIATDYKINATDILRVLSGINITIEKENEKKENSEIKRKTESSSKFSMPSREIDTYHNKLIINNFLDLYKLINSKKQEDRELRESGESEEYKPSKVSYKIQRIFDEDEEKQKICIKILDSINNLLIFKASLSENSESELVASTPLMIQAIVKVLSPIYIDNKIFDKFREYINTNLKKLDFNMIAEDVRKNLFNNLILINYFFNNRTHYNCLSKIFKVAEVINSQFINECLEQVKGHVIALRPEDCDEKEIMQHAGYLVSYIPDSKSMENDFIESLELIKKLLKETEWELVKVYFSNFILMWGELSKDLKKKAFELIKEYPEEKRIYMENILNGKL